MASSPEKSTVDETSLISLSQVSRQVLERYRPDLTEDTEAMRICEKTLSDFLRRADVLPVSVLDLGCGSYDHESVRPELAIETPLEWEPWLCRALHVLGVKVVGVDYFLPSIRDGTPKVEDWSFHQLDLTDPNALSRFPENSFDVVNCHELIGVHLKDELFFDRWCFSPTLEDIAKKRFIPLQKVQENIFAHVLRILNKGGLFIINANGLYRKAEDDQYSEFEIISPKNWPKNLAKPKNP